MPTCDWCKSDSEEAEKHHEGPHTTWCPYFREDQRGGGDGFQSQIMGSWRTDYSWPRMRREYGSRGGGKTQYQQQRKRLSDLVDANRRLFWEARRDSPIIAKSIEIGLSEGLEESEALLLAVVALLEQNRALMKNAMAVIVSSPLPTVFSYSDKEGVGR